MNQLLLTPRARITDPDTSHQAAQSVGTITELHQTIYTLLLHHGPLTDTDLLPLIHRHFDLVSDQSARSRRNELVKMGAVYDSGRKGRTRYDRPSIMWAAK